jgi:hypothetical protein
MFSQDGFCDDRSYTSGLGRAENGRNEMDQENEQIPHKPILSETKTLESCGKLDFARDRENSQLLAPSSRDTTKKAEQIEQLRLILSSLP